MIPPVLGNCINPDTSYTDATGMIVATNPRYGTPYTRSALINALDAAEDKGLHTVLFLPDGVYDIGDGLSMSGRSALLQGTNGSDNTSGPAGAELHASTQNGIALDWKGFVSPSTDNYGGRLRVFGFSVSGSGVADPTKNNACMRVDRLNSMVFSDIVLSASGGPLLKLTADVAGSACFICDFERITLIDPISASANDVPWVDCTEANGNRFVGFILRSRISGGPNVGASGAVLFKSSASFAAHDNLLDTWRTENLFIPNNGTLVSMSVNTHVLRDFQFFDTQKETGASNTSFIRFTAAASNDLGGNIYRGVIPGKGTSPTSPDMGIDLQQSGNFIEGSKGYNGANVIIANGTGFTSLLLRGGVNSPTTLGWTDNSAQTTNHLVDDAAAVEVLPQSWRYATSSPAGVTQSIDFARWSTRDITLTANQIFSGLSNTRRGQVYTIVLRQDATGNRTITFSFPIQWANGAVPVWSTTGNYVDIIQLMNINSASGYVEVSRSIGCH